LQAEVTHRTDRGFVLDTSRKRLLDFFGTRELNLLADSNEARFKLKKETLAVGVICLLLGGLIGYIAGSQIAFRQINEAVSSTSQRESAPPSIPSQNSMPVAPPTVTTSADFETLKKAADAAPSNSALLIQLANKLYDGGRYEEAIPYYERVLALEPQNVNVSTDLGTALFYTGKPDAAIAQFNRSLQIDPRHAQTLHNLVVVNLQGKKDIEAAKDALDRLRNADPNNPSIPDLQSMLSPAGTTKPNPRQTLF
jgi:tetratricopeptide (TPR) repeat protein